MGWGGGVGGSWGRGKIHLGWGWGRVEWVDGSGEGVKISKNMFPGIFFGFDLCNLELFSMENRSSIVPSLQNIQMIQLSMILMSQNIKIEKMSKNNFDQCYNT